MTTYASKPLAVDRTKSNQWAISSLGSFGTGIGKIGVGTQLFDLVNRVTHRAHRWGFSGESVGVAPPIGFTGSYGSSDYVNFTTPREVSFFDFHKIAMTIRETNALLYSWSTVSFWGISVRVAGGGLNVPGLGVSVGVAEVMFGDGKPTGDPDLIIPAPKVPDWPGPTRLTRPDDVRVIRIPGDILFAFDKYLLKPGRRTDDMLARVGGFMNWTPDVGFVVVGHTDNVGDSDYNRRLSKKRAETVAAWLKQHTSVDPRWIKTQGAGESDPIASNATEFGREQNRRVEVYEMRIESWNKL